MTKVFKIAGLMLLGYFIFAALTLVVFGCEVKADNNLTYWQIVQIAEGGDGSGGERGFARHEYSNTEYRGAGFIRINSTTPYISEVITGTITGQTFGDPVGPMSSHGDRGDRQVAGRAVGADGHIIGGI